MGSYSFGSAPAHFGAFSEWNVLVDPPVLVECLNAIFQSPDWWYAHGAASGGDFVLPGATEYQGLHRDTGDYLRDPSGKLDFRDMPCSCITVNFPMEVKQGSSVGHTSHNGVTRHIPGTQNSRAPIPSLEEEPRWMKLATTSPVPAGSVMIRDQRAWVSYTDQLVLGDTLVKLTQLNIQYNYCLYERAARWNAKPVKRSAGDSALWYGVRTVVQHEHAEESATLPVRDSLARRATCMPVHCSRHR